MKKLKSIVPVLLVLVIFAGAADAQRRTRRTAARTPASTKPTVPALDVRTARQKATIQRDNVNFWIDKLGPVAEAFELLDASYAKKKPSDTTLSTHEARKRKFVETLGNLRDDLEILESEFRTKPALQTYLPSLKGITDLAGQAEDLAIAGKFVASKQPLREISKRLTDTLATMPL